MRKQILIVEDEPTLLFAMQEYLAARGYAVETASGLQQAYSCLMNTQYDVVITDIRLSQTHTAEGLDVIDFIRARSSGTAVIVLTGNSSASIERDARRLGIDRFLHKPLPLAAIAEAVSEVNLVER